MSVKQQIYDKIDEIFDLFKTLKRREPSLVERVWYVNKFLQTKLKDPCYVAVSPIHGKGVFAKKDLPSGSIVAIYPVDLIVSPTENFGDPYDQAMYDYGMMLDQLVLYADPRKDHQPPYVAHLANDAKNPVLNNCVFIRSLRGIVLLETTRAVVKDEELLVSYGSTYWNSP